jgi:hypothetical protein
MRRNEDSVEWHASTASAQPGGDMLNARGLLSAAALTWAREEKVIRAYFECHRTAERDLLWLEAQAFKETWDLRALPPHLQAEAWHTGVVAAHPDGPEEAAKLAVEMKHFRLIAELIEGLRGRPVRLEDLPRLKEEETLQALRDPHRRGSAFERAVVNFTEGGGAVMYRVLAELQGGELDRRIARTCRVIHEDEVFHGPAQIYAIDRLARGPDDWALAMQVVRKVGRQRLRMRNEMFSFPVDIERLDDIAAGSIGAWCAPISL